MVPVAGRLYQRALTAATLHNEQLLHLDQNLALAENGAGLFCPESHRLPLTIALSG
jgi:hypothetical protein